MPTIIKHNILQQMNCFRFANVSDNRNIAKIKTQHCQIMATTANRIWKFEPIIKIPLEANYTFFAVFTFNNINSFT